MRHFFAVVAFAFLAGCVQLPPSPEDLQAKRFEPAPDRAVVYLVRQPRDSTEPGGLLMDTGEQITLLPGTYYRWEALPGMRRITGLGPWNVNFPLEVQAGRIYFLRYTVAGTPRMGPQFGTLTPVSEQEGRWLVQQAELVR